MDTDRARSSNAQPHVIVTVPTEEKHVIARAVGSVGIPPKYAGAIRAIAYFVVIMLINIALIYLKTPPQDFVVIAPTVSSTLRIIEGILDQTFKPDMNSVAAEG